MLLLRLKLLNGFLEPIATSERSENFHGVIRKTILLPMPDTKMAHYHAGTAAKYNWTQQTTALSDCYTDGGTDCCYMRSQKGAR